MVGDDIFSVRATRAFPQLLAGADEERRRVYDAALEQFEELLRAAETVGPASRPILLFYALSQAGTAILADKVADAGEWQARGHGLKMQQSEPVTQATATPTRSGRFGAIRDLVGCPPFKGPMELGGVWRANPDLLSVNFEGAQLWPTALRAEWQFAKGLYTSGPVKGVPDALEIEVTLPYGTKPDRADDVLALYPRLAGGERVGDKANALGGFDGVVLRWATEFDDDGVPHPSFSQLTEGRVDVGSLPPSLPLGPRWVVPAVTPGVAPPPFLSWWILLFILSNLARYEPALWRSAIDPSSSRLAVPLERVMELALECLPTRVLEGLRRLPRRA